MTWTNRLPTDANIGEVFWTRHVDGTVRIAEVQEYRGKLELSFTQADTGHRLEDYEYFGPLEPPE